MNSTRRILALAVAIVVMNASVPLAFADSRTLPPSWRTKPRSRSAPKLGTREARDPDELSADDDDDQRRRERSKFTPWYEPQVALGVGLSIPEILPIEGYLFFGRYFALRLFYTPSLPFNIRIEMPADVISTKKGIGVANPDFTIRLKATYGAHYGAEALVFPFGGSFFAMAGVSHRRMRLVGGARSPVLVCSLFEANKDPPCGDPNAAIETRTEIDIHADVETEAILARAGLGWFWHVGSAGYFMFNAGASKPSRIHRQVKVDANLDAPSTSDDEVTGALAQIKTEREADLEQKAVNEMRPVDEKVLPILGIAAGVRF